MNEAEDYLNELLLQPASVGRHDSHEHVERLAERAGSGLQVLWGGARLDGSCFGTQEHLSRVMDYPVCPS